MLVFNQEQKIEAKTGTALEWISSLHFYLLMHQIFVRAFVNLNRDIERQIFGKVEERCHRMRRLFLNLLWLWLHRPYTNMAKDKRTSGESKVMIG